MKDYIQISLRNNYRTKIASISKAVIENIDYISNNMQNNNVDNIKIIFKYENQEGKIVKKSSSLAENELRAYFDRVIARNPKIENLKLFSLELNLEGVDDQIIKKIKNEFIQIYNRVSKQQTEQFKKQKLQEIVEAEKSN